MLDYFRFRKADGGIRDLAVNHNKRIYCRESYVSSFRDPIKVTNKFRNEMIAKLESNGYRCVDIHTFRRME